MLFTGEILANVMRQAEVPVQTQDVCNSSYISPIKDGMFCAGGTGTNTCKARFNRVLKGFSNAC